MRLEGEGGGVVVRGATGRVSLCSLEVVDSFSGMLRFWTQMPQYVDEGDGTEN